MLFYTNITGVKHIKRITVNKSPFVSKKARDQYEIRKYSKVIKSLVTPPKWEYVLPFCDGVHDSKQLTLSGVEISNVVNIFVENG